MSPAFRPPEQDLDDAAKARLKRNRIQVVYGLAGFFVVAMLVVGALSGGIGQDLLALAVIACFVVPGVVYAAFIVKAPGDPDRGEDQR
jgi:hypothetical protein